MAPAGAHGGPPYVSALPAIGDGRAEGPDPPLPPAVIAGAFGLGLGLGLGLGF